MSDEFETRRSETMISKCPHCESQIVVEKIWEAGGCNDYGGWVIECKSCGKPFDLPIGRDVDFSNMISGGTVLDKYYEDQANRAEILTKYNIG